MSDSPSILIVDDEPLVADLAGDILSYAGYEVTLCNSGRQALELMAEQQFDLLFTDLIMPGMTGYRLVEEVSKRYPGQRILLTSGYQIKNEDSHLDAELLANLVEKPYGDKKLIDAVKNSLSEA